MCAVGVVNMLAAIRRMAKMDKTFTCGLKFRCVK